MSTGLRYNAVKKGWPGQGAGSLLLKAKRKKGWATINTHVIPETHFAMHAHTRRTRSGSGRAEWMGANGAGSRPHGQVEVKSSGARGSTRQRSVNAADAAFEGRRKCWIWTSNRLWSEFGVGEEVGYRLKYCSSTVVRNKQWLEFWECIICGTCCGVA